MSLVRAGWLAPVLVLAFPLLLRAEDTLFNEVGPVAPFSLTERSGKTVTLDDLRGKVWVAHFFFRSCTQGCVLTTEAMTELQRRFAGNRDILLVSFTLDPATDTLEELCRYASEHQADPKRWLFLRGDEKAIRAVVEGSFKEGFHNTGDPDPGKKIKHPFRMMVVDRDGTIRGYIRDGRDPDQVRQLADRVRALAGRPLAQVLPAVNAGLNGLCAILLVAGYMAIRLKKEALHKGCMLSALAVSVIFLASYLYFHLAIQGVHTPFTGGGWVQPVYYGVLYSHMVLAALVAPLALFTAYQGLRDRRPRHVRLARWTLPIWLYVSVTGIVVYVMLYQLHPSP
jgi:protein SCO1/2/putative membrane protein